MVEKLTDKNAYELPLLPIAWGEVIDKLTILEIKIEKIKSPDAQMNVKRELEIIENCIKSTMRSLLDFAELKQQLSVVNRALWEVEDKIREKEHKKEFDDEFIQLARSVYIQNDERARIKKSINVLCRSYIVEEKSYISY